jgi:geranylgeranyl reductase family protein
MEADPCDIAIAGGGPAGTSLALVLSSNGFDVRIFEEHSSLGSPSHCAGLVGPGMSDIPYIGDAVRTSTINEISGAVFVSPGGQKFEIRGGKGSALVIDRKIFDRSLGEQAARKGAQIELRSKAAAVSGKSLIVEGERGQRTYDPKVIVGATGSRFTFAKMMGDTTGSVIPGTQFEVGGLSLDPEMVHIYFGKEVSRGLFGWVIPIDAETARVGLCSEEGARQRLERLLETKVKEDFGTGKILEVNAGSVVYGTRTRTVWENVLLLGDEALQTKPATGGGIHYSIICSQIAADVIGDYLEKDAQLSDYERAWRTRLGREVSFGLKVREIYSELADEEIDRLFSSITSRARDLLANSNFDKHTSVGSVLLRFLPRVIREIGLRRTVSLIGSLI